MASNTGRAAHGDHPLRTDEPALASLVECLLSEFLFESTSKQGAHRGTLIRLLKLYAATPAFVGASEVPAPLPEISRSAFSESTAEQVRRRLGRSYNDERRTWDEVRLRKGLFAALDRDYLEHYIDPRLWPVAAAMVKDGPGVYRQRVGRLLAAYAARRVRPTVRRPEGGWIGQGAINSLHTVAGTFVRPLRAHALVSGHPARGYLEAWVSELPKLKRTRSHAPTPDRVTDPHAPSLRGLRLVMASLTQEIHAKLRVRDVADEVETIERLAHVWDRGLFRLLRNRALLLTLCLGPRLRSLVGLHLGDVVADYRHGELPAIDTALRLYLDKRHQPAERTEWVLKPIPEPAVLIYESLIAFYRVVHGELPDDCPLFISYLHDSPVGDRGLIGLTATGARNIVSGTRKQPLREGKKALLPQGTDPYTGYTPHNLRAAASQLLQTPGSRDWCLAHQVDPGRRGAMGEALLDHFMDATMVSVYAGDTTVRGRERLSGWATSIICELLLTDLGARKQPDVAAYRRTNQLIRRCERDLRRVEGELADVRRRAKQLADAGKTLDAILTGTVEAGPLEDERWRLDRRESQLRQRLNELERPENWRVVSDEASEVKGIGFASLRAVPEEPAPPPKQRRRVPVRDWVTREELAAITGRSCTTISRWTRDGVPELLIKQQRTPWDPTRPAPIIEFNASRRAYWVPGLNRQVLFDTHSKKQKLLEARLGLPPIGWRSSPLKTPPAMRPSKLDLARSGSAARINS